jgi:L-tartrate/succinate antiporter
MKLLGRKALGLGFASAFADLSIAPFTPSNTARSCGTVYPVVKNIPPMYGSLPDKEPRRIGAYLMWVCFATTCVTSSWFFTGVAPNLLALNLMKTSLGTAKGVSEIISWGQWFLCMLPMGVILFALVPILTYVIYPPTQKDFPETPKWAGGELEKLGPISRNEILMACMAVLALVLWIFAAKYMNATQVALVILCLMIITGVVSWDDVISNKAAWNVLVWFATLVAMASGLARVGFLAWLGGKFQVYMAGSSEMMVLFGLMFLFYFTHYFFASLTAHTTALFPLMMTIGLAAGVDGRLLGMMMAGSLGIMGILTPYGTGPAPLYYNTGYIERKTFWLFGSLYGFIFFVVYAFFAMTWFPRVLGTWVG